MSSTLRQRRGGQDDGEQGDNSGLVSSSDDPPFLLEEHDSPSENTTNSAEQFFEVGARDEKDPLEPIQAPVLVKQQSRFDKFLSFYIQFMSSTMNQDRGLKLLQWTLWLISTKFANKDKKQGLYKFYLHMSFVRYALRLYGFPQALQAAKTGAYSTFSGTNSKWKNWLGRIMAWSMVFYYPLEHAAYAQWMAPNVVPSTKRTNASKLSAYSCRAWLLYLVAEIGQSLFKLKEMYQQKDQEEEQQVARRQAIRNEQLQVVRSLLFTLPCITWSLPKWDTEPWLREGIVNRLMWLESIVSLIQSLCSFQPKE